MGGFCNLSKKMCELGEVFPKRGLLKKKMIWHPENSSAMLPASLHLATSAESSLIRPLAWQRLQEKPLERRRFYKGFPMVLQGFPKVLHGFPRVLPGFPRVLQGFS